MDNLDEIEVKRLNHRVEEIYRINTFINERNFLYHYSNYENLDKIIGKCYYKFKMTNYENFKDKIEGKLIINLYFEVIKELYDEDIIDIDLYNVLLNVKLNDEGLVKISKEYYDFDKYHLFVACFCNKINDDHMWKNFGNGESENKICVIVPTYLFNTQFMYIDNISSPKMYDGNYILQKVVYN